MTTAKKTTSTTKKAAPAAAKKPQDRKAPASAPQALEVTVNDTTYTVEADALDDFELLDLMYRVESEGNPMFIPEIFRRLLGEDGYKLAMDSSRDERGRVTISAASELLNSIMAGLNPNG